MPALFGRIAAVMLCVAVLAATNPSAVALEPGKQFTVATFNDDNIIISKVVYVELADGRLGVVWDEIEASDLWGMSGQTIRGRFHMGVFLDFLEMQASRRLPLCSTWKGLLIRPAVQLLAITGLCDHRLAIGCRGGPGR